MPNKPYVSLQDRFSIEEQRAKWGVPSKKKAPDTMDSIQEAIEEGWIQPEAQESQETQQQLAQQPITQGIAAVKANAQRKLRRFFHEDGE